MRRARRHLAERLLNNELGDITSYEVLTFFELIGAQTRRRLLDEEMVWEAFGGWITSYYTRLRHPVDRLKQLREQAKDPLLFHHLEWLNDRVVTLDREELGEGYAASVAAVEETGLYLQREAQLVPE
jgi:hypothetical protein